MDISFISYQIMLLTLTLLIGLCQSERMHTGYSTVQYSTVHTVQATFFILKYLVVISHLLLNFIPAFFVISASF